MLAADQPHSARGESWSLGQVYFNFRGGGRGAQLKQEAAAEAVNYGLKKGAKKQNAGASDVAAV